MYTGEMRMYVGEISKRLDVFMDNHIGYEDVGDSENGPELDCFYSGPEWAGRLYEITVLGPLFYLHLVNEEGNGNV